ncbi:hypothetical protein [Azospirillum thermophilum]|uniref:hypothetical protein n=1 Tax=Azospirillum thermophilum TaxID=2202148 RepID=UPI00143DBD2B|nr:hypothetical protein [Azospirillum thermophilum]
MSDKPKQPDQQPQTDKPQKDRTGGERSLTEKEEQRRGGENKNTPGPVYDV